MRARPIAPKPAKQDLMRTRICCPAVVLVCLVACDCGGSDCPDGLVFDPERGVCSCPEGSEPIGGRCEEVGSDGGAVGDGGPEDGGEESDGGLAEDFGAEDMPPVICGWRGIPGECGDPTMIAAGFTHTCLLTLDDEVYCWGEGEFGALGDGTLSPVPTSTPVRVPGFTAQHIATGSTATCAVSDGDVYCWGSGGPLRLGTGFSEQFTPDPVRIEGLPGDAVEVATSASHACARLVDGRLYCWGDNRNGQLGDGTTDDSEIPVRVTTLASVDEVHMDTRYTCARSGGQVYCWGRALESSTSDRHVPVEVTGISDAVQLSTSGGTACVRRAAGLVSCWGSNSKNQVGTGSTEPNVVDSPTPVSGLSDAVHVAVSGSHVCAIRVGGQALCWGSNITGQIGNGSIMEWEPPEPVSGLDDAVQVTSGGQGHTCAIRESGTPVCWGFNEQGQLGTGDLSVRLVPDDVLTP